MPSALPFVVKTGLNQAVKRSVGRFYMNRTRQVWDISEDEYWEYPRARFHEIYSFARERVPFYQKSPNDYPGLDSGWNQAHILEILQRFPVIEKASLKEFNEEFWPRPLLPLTTIHTTSGTTGTPLRVPATVFERARINAILGSWYERITGTTTPKTMVLDARLTLGQDDGKIFRVDRLTNRVFLSIYSLTADRKTEIDQLFRDFNPQMIYGYPSAMNQLAKLYSREPRALKESCVAVTTADVLEPHWRTAIESSLVRKVYDFYGSQEGAHLAFECELGRLHINPMVGIVEILDGQGRPAKRGEAGKVVVTSLLRKSFPMIRYALGDVAVSETYATDCECGLHWPAMGLVRGRTDDMVITRDGREIGHFLFFHATKDVRGVKEAQLVQKDYEDFDFFVVPNPDEPLRRAELEKSVLNAVQLRVQAPINMQFHYVDTIERGANGKFKTVVVKFDRQQ